MNDLSNDSTPTRAITARLVLSQRGKNGAISPDIEFTPRNEKAVPAAHEAMSQLVALYLQLQTMLDVESEISEDAPTYTASFELSQDEEDGPVYSYLRMSPRITAADPNFPSSYEVASYIATAWLQMCGVIDENGDLMDEDALEFQAIDAKERRVH